MSSSQTAARQEPGPRHLRQGSFDEEEHLTNREREILGLFAEGLGTQAISRRLSIARVTVRNHAQRILTKLSVHSRLAAVARGYRDGLIGRDVGPPPRTPLMQPHYCSCPACPARMRVHGQIVSD
jgi:DNA-binding NarL/FixJ family response regulator